MAIVTGEEYHDQLLKSQRATVAASIKNAGLETNSFSWSETKSRNSDSVSVPMLLHNKSDFRFVFDKDSDINGAEYWAVSYSPGRESFWEYSNGGNWDGVVHAFNQWVRLVKREEEAEDPWSSEDIEDFEDNWKSSNEKFDIKEINKINAGLDAVQAFLIEKSSQDEQVIENIQNGINDLKNSATNLGRKDWLMLFIGWFITHSLDWSVTNVHWHEVVKVLLKGTKIYFIGA